MQKILRILGGIAGGLAIVFGLNQIFGTSGMRDCDDPEVQTTIRDLAIQLAPPGLTGNGDANSEAGKKARADLKMSGISEKSWDKEKEIRVCNVTFDLKIGMATIYDSTKMEYSISRSSTDSDTLNVFLKPAA